MGCRGRRCRLSTSKTSSGGTWGEGTGPAACTTMVRGLLVEMQILSLHAAPCFLCSGGNEIKPQIYTSYAMFFMAVSTALRKMCKIPNVSVDYAVAQCGNLKRVYNLSRNGGGREAWRPPRAGQPQGGQQPRLAKCRWEEATWCSLDHGEPTASSEGWGSAAPTRPSAAGQSH